MKINHAQKVCIDNESVQKQNPQNSAQITMF